jgi:hypothetical protein
MRVKRAWLCYEIHRQQILGTSILRQSRQSCRGKQRGEECVSKAHQIISPKVSPIIMTTES